MTITKAHLHHLFVLREKLNELLRTDPVNTTKWSDGCRRLSKTAESYGLDLMVWYYVRNLIDFVDDVNDGLAAEERFYIVDQTLRQIGVEITEEED